VSAAAVRHCPNPACPFARARGRPAEYRADIVRCSDCGAELSEAPLAPPPSAGPVTAATWGRLVVTVAAPIAMLAVSLAPLPGVGMGAGSVVGAAFQPIVEAFLAVELVAWLVPPWRALREGGPSGRAILTLLALALSLALCALQGLNSGLMLERWGHAAPWTPVLYAVYLVAGALVVWGLALLVDRRGLGGGFALLLVVAMGGRELAGLWQRLREGTNAPAQIAILIGVYGILATATVWLLRSRRAEPVREPAAGVLPVLGASWLAATIWTLSLLAETWLGTRRLPYFRPDGTPYLTFELVTAAVLSIGAGYALHRRALPPARLKPAILRSVLFSVLLLLAPAYVTLGSGLDRVPAAVAVVFAAALWEDFRREIDARRRDPTLGSVWPVRTTAAATRAVETLRAAGLEAFPRGEAMHALLHVFGPFLPVSILVPRSSVPDAKRLLADPLRAPIS
jgi:hypothetical protein